jgi:hypothetical protein
MKTPPLYMDPFIYITNIGHCLIEVVDITDSAELLLFKKKFY